MKPFTYFRAAELNAAKNEFVKQTGSQFIAGGTNLLDLIKENVARPDRLIDITKLPLNAITRLENGGLRLGALVTNAETAKHPHVVQDYPLLSKAILAGAFSTTPQHGDRRGKFITKDALSLFL